jgi:uncharacterized protein YfcZ (UPF0381/DUF406 family)
LKLDLLRELKKQQEELFVVLEELAFYQKNQAEDEESKVGTDTKRKLNFILSLSFDVDPVEFPDEREKVSLAQLEAFARHIQQQGDEEDESGGEKSSYDALKSFLLIEPSLIQGNRTGFDLGPSGNFLLENVKKPSLDELLEPSHLTELLGPTKARELIEQQETEGSSSLSMEGKEGESERKKQEGLVFSYLQDDLPASHLYVLNDLPFFSMINEALDVTKEGNMLLQSNASSMVRNRRKDLEERKHFLMDEIQASIESFEEMIASLSLERFQIVDQVKQLNLNVLTMYQEYFMLKTFDTKDELLILRKETIEEEKKNMTLSMTQLAEEWKEKDEHIKELQETISFYNKQVYTLIPESHPQKDILIKIFKKKVRKPTTMDDDDWDSDEESDEESDYDSDEDGDEDDDDEEEVEDICPIGCNPDLFGDVLDLRDKRTESEMELKQVDKLRTEVKKSLDRLKTRMKQVEKDALNIQSEINQLQKLKMKSLNKLKTVRPIRLSQLYCLRESGSSFLNASIPTSEDYQPSSSSSPARGSTDEQQHPLLSQEEKKDDEDKPLSFSKLTDHIGLRSHSLLPKMEIERLKQRISELQREIQEEKRRLKFLKNQNIHLTKKMRFLETDIQELEGKSVDLQMLKFGQLIDLDLFDNTSSLAQGESAMEEKIRSMERRKRTILSNLETERRKVENQLLETTKDNTDLLQNISSVSHQIFDIEQELTKATEEGIDGGNNEPAIRREIEERNRLISLVKLQAREIEGLRAEVQLLSYKGPVPLTELDEDMDD